MLNIMLTGVGGQGTVLAAKILAQAAQERGWQVRTAETIGMAQRGGSVVSHVRMGDQGEEVYSSLLAHGTADLLIAFEPAEGARMLPFLKPEGVLVTATSDEQPVTAALSDNPYRGADVLSALQDYFAENPSRLVVVNDRALMRAVRNRKALNTVMLAAALEGGHVPLTIDDLKAAIRVCVKPKFVDMNLAAVDAVVAQNA